MASVDGLLTPGNIDLKNRPVVNNPDGTHSTVKTTTVEMDGKTYLLPTIVGGKEVSVDDAVAHYRKTGEHIGIFSSEKAAEEFDKGLHNKMGWNGAPGSSQEAWQKSAGGSMADETKQPELKSISQDKLIGWFNGKIKEQTDAHEGPQLNLLNQLYEKNNRKPTRDELIGAIAELPAIKSKYRIEGFGEKPGPPAKAGEGKPSEERGVVGKVWDGASGSLVKKATGTSMREYVHNDESKRSAAANKEGKPFSNTERFVGQAMEEVAGLGDTLLSPIGLLTAGIGPRIRMLAKLPEASKFIKGLYRADQFTRAGFSGAQAVNAATAYGDYTKDPTPENAAKLVSSGALSVAAIAPDVIAGGKRVAGAVSKLPEVVSRIPGAVKAGAEGYKAGVEADRASIGNSNAKPSAVNQPGPYQQWREQHFTKTPEGWVSKANGGIYTDERRMEMFDKGETPEAPGKPKPPPQALPAGGYNPANPADVIRAGRTLEAGPAPGLPEEFLQSTESKTGLSRDRIGILNKLSTEDMLKRVDYYKQRLSQMPSDRNYGEKLSDEQKKAGAIRTTLQNERTAAEELLKQRGVAIHEKSTPGPTMHVRTPDTDLVPSGTRAVATRQPQPPPRTGEAPVAQQRQIGAPPQPAGLIKGGDDAYFAEHPQVDQTPRISRAEANQLAQKNGVKPDTLLKLSEHTNEELMGYVKELYTLRGAIDKSPGDMMPRPEGTSGYPVHKQEYLDQLNRHIEAVEGMLLHTSRSKVQPPTKK